MRFHVLRQPHFVYNIKATPHNWGVRYCLKELPYVLQRPCIPPF